MFGKVGFEGCVDNWMQSQKCDAGECNILHMFSLTYFFFFD